VKFVKNLRAIRRREALRSGLLFGALLTLAPSREIWAATYDVGPGQPFSTIASVPKPSPGDVVQIHCGTYNEVRRWTTSGTSSNPITLKSVCATSRPVIDGAGQSVTGNGSIPRAIWQIEGSNYVIDGLEFKNARNGSNGAGIRVLNSSVTIQNVKITYCDMGVLTSTISADNVLVQYSEIANNGTGKLDGQSHNVYLTQGGTITFQFCYIHDAVSGTNFKSRAHYSQLFYNFISHGAQNEAEGVDAQDTTTPNSNMTMIGNILVSTPNRKLNSSQFIVFGQDVGGTHNGTLYLINNTLVAGSPSIGFLRSNASDSSIVSVNNIYYGSNTIVQPGYSTNVTGTNNWLPSGAVIPLGFSANNTGADPGFVNAASDFHLVSGAPASDMGLNSPTYVDGSGVAHLGTPLFEYVEDLGSTPRPTDGTLDAGAYEAPPQLPESR
jgi:hypothetical protein